MDVAREVKKLAGESRNSLRRESEKLAHQRAQIKLAIEMHEKKYSSKVSAGASPTGVLAC